MFSDLSLYDVNKIWYRITSTDKQLDIVVHTHESWLPYLTKNENYTLQEIPAKRALKLKKILEEKRLRKQRKMSSWPLYIKTMEELWSNPATEICVLDPKGEIITSQTMGPGMSFLAKLSLTNILIRQFNKDRYIKAVNNQNKESFYRNIKRKLR